jgi:ABC-2 type transport system ATP-binding protein
VEAVCDRVIIIMNGQIKADAHLSELSTSDDAVLVLQTKTDGVEQSLQSLSRVREVEALPADSDGHPTYRISGQAETDLCPAIYDLARSQNWPLRELRRDTHTLETVFNELATAPEVNQ